MKLPKLLKIAQEILGDETSKACERKKCLKEIQRKLKKKSKKLKERLLNENNDEIKKSLAKELAVISAQRKKIIKAIKMMKKKT